VHSVEKILKSEAFAVNSYHRIDITKPVLVDDVQLAALVVLQSSVAASSNVASGGFSSRGFGSTSTQPVSSKPTSIVGSYQTTGGYSGSDTYQTSLSQYGSDSYYSSTTTTASYGRGSYGSYQPYSASGPDAASKQASSYTQPVGRGSYAMAGDDSSYATYSWASGYDSGYHTPAGTDTSASGTYGAYDESGYYMETEESQSYAGYDSGGNYGNVDRSQQSYDYSSSYDSGYSSGYGSGSSTTTFYGTARPSTTASYTTTASYMHAGGSFGRPVSSAPTSSVRTSSLAAGKSTSSTDQYYTSAGKADPYAGYGGADYWSSEDQSYYYGETEGGYGGYGESAGEYDDYSGSNQDVGGEWGYPTDQTGGGGGYPSNQSYAASTGYQESATRGRSAWSGAPTGLGRGTGQLADTSTQYPATSGPTGSRGSSTFQVPYGASTTAASTGFQAGRGGRQTTAGGTGFQTSSYGTASLLQAGTTFSSAATGYSSSWGGGGGQKSASASVGPATSQRTPRVDGFVSYVSGTVSSSGVTKSTSTTRFSEPRSDSEKRPSRWSDGKTGTSDTQQDTSRQAGSSSHYGRSSSAQQPSDNGAPRVFDYGHRDCDEQQAARSSDRSYYLSSVNTAKPAAAVAKRASSPSPDYRRPSSSAGSDWQTSSRRDDARESSRSLVAGRSRDYQRSSVDTYDHRKPTPYSEKSSSGSARHSSSYGQGSSMQGRPSQDRWYTTEPGTSSRSSSVGQRTGEPARTVARTVASLMDNMLLYSTSSAKTTPVCVPWLSVFILFLVCLSQCSIVSQLLLLVLFSFFVQQTCFPQLL